MMAPTASALLAGLDQAIADVNDTLEFSFAKREEFNCTRDAVLSSFVVEMGRINEEFDVTSSEHKRRKGPIKPETNGGCDVFTLPELPDE